ncbi:MAG TPA: hypothetical protein DF712_03200 [Balneola sp.]|nr:hypothetical protein [Balneola sp.]
MDKYPKNIDIDAYNSETLEKVNKLEKMFQSAKDARKAQVMRWRRNEELYNGQMLKPFNLPKYKTRIEPNVIHSVVETMFAILTDRPSKVDIMPKREEQIASAMKAQEAVEWVMANKKAERSIRYMKRDGLIYGNGFLKTCIVNGEIEFIVPDIFTVFIDPLATSIEDASCVIFATPTYVDDIEEKYGKRVNPEGKMNEYRSFIKSEKQYATDKVPELDTQSSLEEDGNSQDYKGGQALLKECWYYEGGEFRLATFCGKTLLQDEKAPYKHFPLVTFKNYPSAHSFYGKGEPEVIESLAVGSSIALSQGMDNLILQGNPVVVMSKSLSKIPGNRMTDKPGQVLWTNNPSERIDRLPAGNISASTLPFAQSMIEFADMVSGVHEISRGINPTGVVASRAIQQLQEASQQIIRAKEKSIGADAIIDIYKQTLTLLAKNYAETISVRRYLEDGSGYQFEDIQPYDLDPDMDFKYKEGSSMPESRVGRFDSAIDLLQLGLLDEEGFWRWTQMDITKEKLEEIAQARKQRQEAVQKEVETISQSTDEDEIMDSLLRYRELTGGGAQDAEEQNT